MSTVLAIILSSLFGLGSLLSPGKSIQPLPPPPVPFCLNEQQAQNGIDPGLTRVPKVLQSIKKPSRTNTEAAYEIVDCQNQGGCDGPDVANYHLIATNIQLNHVVFPNSFDPGMQISERQLVKQIDYTDNPILADRYRGHIYRSWCGDWCATCKAADAICFDPECLTGICPNTSPLLTLQWRGSYHCNFIFYLQDNDPAGNPQLDENGNVLKNSSADPNLPADGSYFSVYFRDQATLPPDIECDNGNISQSDAVVPTPVISTIGPLFEYPALSQQYWRVVRNPSRPDGSYLARNTEINPFSYLGQVSNPAGLTGTFDLYANLLDPISDVLMYLTPPNSVNNLTQSLAGSPPQIKLFSYFQLERWSDASDQKSLKLATFPLKTDWIKKWVMESKPAIYLYPEAKTEVTVKLNPSGKLTVSDPPYDQTKGWQVTAFPEGTLNTANGSYPYLYYEAQLSKYPRHDDGFVVDKNNLAAFFNDKLSILGLNSKETKDFNDYWLPRLTKTGGKYLFISFLTKDEIEAIEPINISVPFDTALRVRAYFKPLDTPVSVRPQILVSPPVRSGSALVEWGGILDN